MYTNQIILSVVRVRPLSSLKVNVVKSSIESGASGGAEKTIRPKSEVIDYRRAEESLEVFVHHRVDDWSGPTDTVS